MAKHDSYTSYAEAHKAENWMSVVSGVEITEIPKFETPEDLAAFRKDPSRDLSIHNVDLPDLAQFHERVVLRSRDGYDLTAEIYVPHGEPPFPTVMYLHGGGWTWGKAEYVRKLGMTIAERRHVVVNLEYPLAPEHRFPYAVEDTVYASRWIQKNIQEYGGDPSRFVIGGASAGANLSSAAIVALTADEDMVDGGDLAGVPVEFTGALFLYGVFDFVLASLEPGSNVSSDLTGVMFNQSYLGPRYLHLWRHPLVSAVYAPNLDRFPPTFVICGDRDRHLHQSLGITKALHDVNVPVTLTVPAGLDHSFAYVTYKYPDAARELERMFEWLETKTHPERAESLV
jgi:acetyl esterase